MTDADTMTVLRDILATMHEGHGTSGREADAFYRRATDLRCEAVLAFAAINGWRFHPNYFFQPRRLGQAHRDHDYACPGWFDHPLHFKAVRKDGKRGLINVAIVGQPYGLAHGVRDELDQLIDDGFVLHVPRNAFASIWYPGSTLFLVLTLPGITVRWLPEQESVVPQLIGREDAEEAGTLAALAARAMVLP